jgi:hypothetical protein
MIGKSLAVGRLQNASIIGSTSEYIDIFLAAMHAIEAYQG